MEGDLSNQKQLKTRDRPIDRWTDGPMVRWTDGPMDRWTDTDGPMDRSLWPSSQAQEVKPVKKSTGLLFGRPNTRDSKLVAFFTGLGSQAREEGHRLVIQYT